MTRASPQRKPRAAPRPADAVAAEALLRAEEALALAEDTNRTVREMRAVLQRMDESLFKPEPGETHGLLHRLAVMERHAAAMALATETTRRKITGTADLVKATTLITGALVAGAVAVWKFATGQHP